MKIPFVSAVILACGNGSRFGGDKLFCNLSGKTVLERTLSVFDSSDSYNEIILVTRSDLISRVKELSKNFSKVSKIIEGGDSRMKSALKGLEAVNDEAQFVAVHDGARPLLEIEDAKAVVENAILYGASILAFPASDTVKTTEGGFITSTPDRKTIYNAQTPQVFPFKEYKAILEAAIKAGHDFTDDSSIYESSGKKVYITEGKRTNIKITYPEDLKLAETLIGKEKPKMRIGHGYDVHKLAENRKLILGGQEIPFEKGLLGHSDADVLVHAIMDSLLGAAAMGDIGKLFPDTDMAFKDADSIELLKSVGKEIDKAGYKIVNIDSVVCAQKPKIAPFIENMRKNIAAALGIDITQVNVKATTEEGLGFTGNLEGISSTAVCIIEDK
ncbi:MAG: 2-C-methyl-D-erythritol 2,4-cyclodiphosphate synthase [Oscillospiraceae bacterium]|nr:2-C-methyl-D-erythritol 2,4-cyclodiphosphate synthase [Oscillospiraceae bacterium]